MSRKSFVQILCVIAGGLVIVNLICASLGHPIWNIHRLIYLSAESNFSTWFTSMMLFVGAYFTYECSTLIPKGEIEKRWWQLTALGVLLLSCDEVAMIHEHFGAQLTKYTIGAEVRASSWVVILGPVALVILVSFFFFMSKYLVKSPKAFKWLALGFFMYLGGALVLEFFLNPITESGIGWLMYMEKTLEETFEMFGVIFCLIGLLAHQEYLKRV